MPGVKTWDVTMAWVSILVSHWWGSDFLLHVTL